MVVEGEEWKVSVANQTRKTFTNFLNFSFMNQHFHIEASSAESIAIEIKIHTSRTDMII